MNYVYLPGRRNPLRMLSNAIDFRTRRKQRPKSADFENPEDTQSDSRSQSSGTMPVTGERSGGRSASVTDILECVSLSPGPQAGKEAKPRMLEGRNSAPDMLRAPGDTLGLGAVATLGSRSARARARLSAAASAKQKLSTRFQPQRKAQHQHRLITQAQQPSSSVKRAKTFSLGGPGTGPVQAGFKTLPKQASSRSIGSTSTDSSQSGQSTASSRKSSNSSNISDVSMNSAAVTEISQTALEEIAAFEKFITEYFENTDNNNTIRQKASQSVAGGIAKQKVSASSILSEVLELSI